VELHLHDNLAVDANGRAVPQTGRYTAGTARACRHAERPLPAAAPAVLPARSWKTGILLARRAALGP
jgi:hypothetical protein